MWFAECIYYTKQHDDAEHEMSDTEDNEAICDEPADLSSAEPNSDPIADINADISTKPSADPSADPGADYDEPSDPIYDTPDDLSDANGKVTPSSCR